MIAVLRELEARGPFCNLVMSVTVVKDVLVLLLFAVNLEVVGALLEASPTPSSSTSRLVSVMLSCVLAPLLKVLLSLILGAGGGVVLGALQLRGGEDRSLHPATILLLAAALFLGSRALPAEPLLVCVTAGAVAANRREERGEAQREELHALLGGLMPPINLCFFCLAGASLGVDALVGTAPIALIIHAVRLLSLICATHASSFGLPRELRRCVWMAMVTQAGVALGLGLALVSAALIAWWRVEISSLYTEDAVVIALTAELLLLAAVFQLSDAAQVVTAGAIRGYKITRAPMRVQLLAFWVVSLPLGYVLGIAPHWAPEWLRALPWFPAQPMMAAGFWIALVLGLTVAGAGLLLLLRKVASEHLGAGADHP